MRLALLAPLTVAVLSSAGCGARTGEDELLTGDLTAVGGLSSGGFGGSGGFGATGGIFATGGVATGGGAGGAGPSVCCQVSAGRGCIDDSIEACVCAVDSFCCTGAWDATCVDVIEDSGCGSCSTGAGGSGGGSGGGTPVGDCCSARPETGCSEVGIQDCVCDLDRFCCESEWDATCVSEVSQCNASCETGSGGRGAGGSGGQNTGGGGGSGGEGIGGGGGVGGIGGIGGGSGDCCEVHSTPRCNDTPIEDCVCEEDSYCCDTAWDGLCVERATVSCNAGCGMGGVGGGATGGGGNIGIGGTGGIGAGGMGSGGGGSSYCDYLPGGSCESCVCNSCYDTLVGCLGDAGCTCILSSGCSGVAECLAPETCGNVLTGGSAFASIALAYQLATCQDSSGCPCP